MEIKVRSNFSETVINTLTKRKLSKRWLYYKLEMAPATFELRLKQNDWRLGEIMKISNLLGL